jgi:hypothetical protein
MHHKNPAKNMLKNLGFGATAGCSQDGEVEKDDGI